MSAATMSAPIENRVTGDRLQVLRRGEALLDVQFDLPPGAAGSPLHVHARLEERFEVLDGELRLHLDGHWQTLGAGEAVVVRPGVVHGFTNASKHWVTFTTEVRPAARFERFLRTWHGLANAGGTNKDGVPRNVFHLARCLQDADFTFAGAPALPQRLLRDGLVRLGGLVGAYAALGAYEEKQ